MPSQIFSALDGIRVCFISPTLNACLLAVMYYLLSSSSITWTGRGRRTSFASATRGFLRARGVGGRLFNAVALCRTPRPYRLGVGGTARVGRGRRV